MFLKGYDKLKEVDRKMEDRVLLLLFVCTVAISTVSAQNCTNTQFLDGGLCKNCGANSEGKGTTCLCKEEPTAFKRRSQDKNDYTKDCYQSPSQPKNVKLTFSNSTVIAYRWEKPKWNDQHLTTKYLIRFGDCVVGNPDVTCSLKPQPSLLINTEYVISGLNPRTIYHIIICSENDVSSQACTDDDHIPIVRTSDGKPGVFLMNDFTLESQKNADKFYFHFGSPSYMGAEEITVTITCDDSSTTTVSANFTESTIQTSQNGQNNKNSISVAKICAELIKCSIYAKNKYGEGETKSKFFKIGDNCKIEPTGSDTVAIVTSIVVIVVVVVVLAFGYLWWWKRKQAKMERKWMLQLERANNLSNSMMQPFRPRNLYVDAMDVEQIIARTFEGGELEEDATYFTDDMFDFEFQRDNLNILHKLGEGNFAYVYKAEAIDIAGHSGVSQVAVKVLKDAADEKDQNDFMDELELMKQIKPNKNVVRLLGCCTGKGQIAMIVEFLPAGDLLDFLRKSKQYAGEKGAGASLSEKDFLKFAHDIAAGMAHLASHNIVHRDLACRNVLVSSSRNCKIADMGLARILGDDGVYMREKEAKLPIKWMSPESLLHGRSYIKSDVWAFGITFWEILTVGSSPYPGYKSKDVAQLLRKKYRMEKPKHCSDELYNIMADCWHEAYDSRPTFDMLKERLQPLTETDENYMNFDSFQEDLYISFDDADDDLNIDQINNNHSQEATTALDNGGGWGGASFAYDNGGNAERKPFNVDLENPQKIRYQTSPKM